MGVGRGGKHGYMVLDEDGEDGGADGAWDGAVGGVGGGGGAGPGGREPSRADMARLRRLRARRAAKRASEPGYLRVRTKHALLCAAAACFGVVLLLVVFGVLGNPFMIHAGGDGAAARAWGAWCADHRADATALSAPCPRHVPGH